MKKILNFFKERKLLSLILLFVLYVNSLPVRTLPDLDTVSGDEFQSVEITIPSKRALLIVGGDDFANSNLGSFNKLQNPDGSGDPFHKPETPQGDGGNESDRLQNYDYDLSSKNRPKGNSGGNAPNQPNEETLKNNAIPDDKYWKVNDSDCIEEDEDHCDKPERLAFAFDFKYVVNPS